MARGNGWKVTRVYGAANGARFAAVQFESGQRVDVRVRGSKDGKLLNAWGDPYPYEETRRVEITRMAARVAVQEDAAWDAATRAGKVRENPPLVAFANPPALRSVALQSGRVYELAYRHIDDGKDYKHKFGPGVCMQLLDDGSIRLYHEHGKPLFGDF